MNLPALAIVLKGYPRLSETFIAQEILNLERSGFPIALYSLRRPTDPTTHPIHDEIQAPVVYLPEYLYQEPGRLLRGWRQIRRVPGFSDALRLFWRDLRHDPTPNRIRRFGQAIILAAELPDDTPALYAHFLHTPASVAFYTAVILRIPWACSAHAKDIYTTSALEIERKLEHCQWLTTCTNQNNIHLRALCNNPEKIKLNYHGIDLQRFEDRDPEYSERNGSEINDPVIILSVGRAVEKKGYAGLLNALAAVRKDLSWKMVHIGSGPLVPALKKQADTLNIANKIEWLGPQAQHTVIEQYRRADIFVLNSCIDRHGDRDGLPNVMVEAQSQGLPVIGTDLSGIPELIEHAHNGLMVEPGNQTELVNSLERLISRPELRQQYGNAGKIKVRELFDMRSSLSNLKQLIASLTHSNSARQ